MDEALRRSVLLGAATGLRSTGGLAALALAGGTKGGPRLRSRDAGRALGLAWFLESVADKVLPLPARTEPAPLLGRIALGATAAAWAHGGPGSARVRAAVVGGATAALTAWVATSLRARATRHGLPDLLPALAEDVAVALVVRDLGGGSA